MQHGNRGYDINMADYALDRVVERLLRNGEAEWKGKLPPTFLRENNLAAQSENLQRYMTEYPWIVIAEDRGGYLCYFCAICKKVATIFHILSDAHVNKTYHNFAAQLGVLHAALDGKIPGRGHQAREPLQRVRG